MGVSEVISIIKTIPWLYKLLKPTVERFHEKTPIEKLFGDVSSDVLQGKSNKSTSKKISKILKNELYYHSKHMARSNYTSFARDITSILANRFDKNLINIWGEKMNIIDLKYINEIQIACEPMLDLISDDGSGAFDLLRKQIELVDKITYFVENKEYYDDLMKMLETANIDTSKIQLRVITNKLEMPVVLYINNHITVGVYGKYHPHIRKTTDGTYELRSILDSDWMQFFSREDGIEEVKCKLKERSKL